MVDSRIAQDCLDSIIDEREPHPSIVFSALSQIQAHAKLKLFTTKAHFRDLLIVFEARNFDESSRKKPTS